MQHSALTWIQVRFRTRCYIYSIVKRPAGFLSCDLNTGLERNQTPFRPFAETPSLFKKTLPLLWFLHPKTYHRFQSQVCVALMQGICLNPGDIVVLCIMATLCTMGTAPVPSASLVLLATLLSMLDIPVTETLVAPAMFWFWCDGKLASFENKETPWDTKSHKFFLLL